MMFLSFLKNVGLFSDCTIVQSQVEEEGIEIDENGVAHAMGITLYTLKGTVLRDPGGTTE